MSITIGWGTGTGTFPATKKKALKARIESIFREIREIYGSPGIQKQLEREGLLYSRSYVALLMKKMGLRSVLRRKYVATTDSDHSFPFKRNDLDREFKCGVLGKKWVSDITYVRVGDNWNYLTTIIDLADRKVVGWSLSDDMTTGNTVLKAWIEARRNRNIVDVFYSIPTMAYNMLRRMADILDNRKSVRSMSGKGNCWEGSAFST